MSTPVSPSTDLKAFSCPHCGVLTTQYWRRLLVSYYDKESRPFRINNAEEFKQRFREMMRESGRDDPDPPEWVDRIATGLPSIGDAYNKTALEFDNADVSECYHCSKMTVWVGNAIVWPRQSAAPAPNPDLPEEIVRDYREAGEIVDSSPRGAAALLRLCLQKLCVHLGESGKNIYEDIGSLVKKGLDPRVQQMADTLRVFGNNAVHPGEIDLSDDRPTADKLFYLVNLITDIMISQPKTIHELYDRIGPDQLDAIKRRDVET